MTMRVAEALAHARALGLARLDAQLLLSRRLQQSRTWLLAHDDDLMTAQAWAAFESDVARRAGGEPLAYIVGQREFHGLTLQVTPSVLVPRPETELLVDWGLEHLAARRRAGSPLTAIDLGTGSGAIALAIKHRHPAVGMMAVDRSQDALQVARANARSLALEIEFAFSDWWAAAAGRTFDLALANPPYIDADDGHLQQLSHEPADALTPGRDGMSAIREVIQGAPMHLNAGAVLLVEHGYDQAPAVRDLLGRNGFFDIETRNDLAGIPRCTGAHRG